MKRRAPVARPVALSIALGALAACAPHPAPLHVPGPTTSHPFAPAISARPIGLPTVALRDGSNVVAIRVAFASGSADDPAGKDGLTRLTAKTMTEGGTQARSYAELVRALYPTAAEIRVRVDRDETVFYADVAAAKLPVFYPLLKEVLLSPLLDEAGVERMRQRARSELTDELRGANDEALSKEALAAALYEGHPYGHPPVGTESGLAAATAEDVRAQRARVFCRQRVMLGVAGGFPAEFDAQLARDFEVLPNCAAPRVELPPATAASAPRLFLVDKPTAESTAIAMGTPIDVTRRSADSPALAFFADYLGLHRQGAGVLFHELRERRGLNYGDYAYSEYFEEDPGTRFAAPNLARRDQMFSIWIRPVPPKNAAFALRAALHFYREALDRGIPQAEIARFREYLTRYTTLQELTESRRLGDALDDLTYGSSTRYLPGLREAWKDLDQASLKAAAQRHLKDRPLTIAIVAKNAAAVADELVGGRPTPPSYDAPKPEDVVRADDAIGRTPLGLTRENVKIIEVSQLFR